MPANVRLALEVIGDIPIRGRPQPRGQLHGVYDPEVTGRMSKKIF
jgi:hypothetical protein